MLHTLTIRQAHEGLKNKTFSSVELTRACLDRIQERNPIINGFISVFETESLQEAAHADKKIANGEQELLTGIPFAVKDAICTKDGLSTASAKILDTYVPPFDATVIARIRAQGAVLLGKNNCDAFGHGSSNENSMYGPVANPFDTTKVAGGSSGGSAAAVADHQAIFSIGEDTGGSIRFPASLCGIVGFRPTYGRNSRYGIMPMASSLDVVGPFAKTVEDAALLMEVMAGRDKKDATSLHDAVPAYAKELHREAKTFTIGVPKEYFEVDAMDSETKQLVQEQIGALEKTGARIVPVSLPHTKYAIPTYYIIVPSEDSSNLGRIDGIRYGVQASGDSLYDMYANSRAQGFPQEVKRRIMIGSYALSAGYYDAYYTKAQKVRTKITQDFDTVFQDVDVLVTPTSPYPAWNIGEKAQNPLALYLADVLVSPASLAGVPALSVGIGKTKAGLPVGLQVIGPRLGELAVLQLAHIIDTMHQGL